MVEEHVATALVRIESKLDYVTELQKGFVLRTEKTLDAHAADLHMHNERVVSMIGDISSGKEINSDRINRIWLVLFLYVTLTSGIIGFLVNLHIRG